MTTRKHSKAAGPLLSLVLLGLGACGGGPAAKATYGPPPRSLGGFTSETLTEVAKSKVFISVEASYVANHKRILGADLTRKGVLPLRLNLGLRGDQMDKAAIRMDADTFDLRMYLPNGSVLVPATPEQVQKASGKTNFTKKVTPHTLEAGVLPELATAQQKELFVFLNLNLEDAKVKNHQLTFKEGAELKTLNLNKALLTFNLKLENKSQAFSVGINNK